VIGRIRHRHNLFIIFSSVVIYIFNVILNRFYFQWSSSYHFLTPINSPPSLRSCRMPALPILRWLRHQAITSFSLSVAAVVVQPRRGGFPEMMSTRMLAAGLTTVRYSFLCYRLSLIAKEGRATIYSADEIDHIHFHRELSAVCMYVGL